MKEIPNLFHDYKRMANRYELQENNTPAKKSISATGPIRPPTLFPLLSLPFAPHIVPEDDSNQKAVTVKTDCSFKSYGCWWYKKMHFKYFSPAHLEIWQT